MKNLATSEPQTSRTLNGVPVRSVHRDRSVPQRADHEILSAPHASRNQAMQRLLRSESIQTKLTVNQPGDEYEQEADRVAESVMRMPDSAREDVGNSVTVPNIQRMCTECDEEEVQRKERPGNEAISPDFSHPQGGGQALPDAERNFFEPRFGRDFSHVRLHTDAQAANAARSIKALAYTKGSDVVFGAEQYRPGTNSGRTLLAHELAHVVQQGKSSPAYQRKADSPRLSVNTTLIQRQQPAPVCAHPGVSRTLDLQPVFLRTGPTDTNPTGRTWNRRLSAANRIWGKLGVTFNGLAAVTIDTPLKSTGATPAELSAIAALHSGPGPEVFLADNDVASGVPGSFGGATTIGPLAALCGPGKIVMADRGSSNTLLAHELGHILGIQHPGTPPNPGDTRTIMVGSGSHSRNSSTRNTMVNYNAILCPAGGGPTCLHPDT